MANAQYSIPESFLNPEPAPSFEAQQADTFSAQLDAQYYTPEAMPSTYGYVKEVCARLNSYRNTQIALEEKRHKKLKAVKALVMTPKPVLAELIEKESVIGGKMFAKPAENIENRFWEQDGGFYYGFTDGKNIKLEDTVIHYEFSDEAIEKLYQGRPVPLVPHEEENITEAIMTFEQRVMHELYPFDEVIQELSKDDFGLAA
jgi:hypothetical protein